nr:uncharacterized protein LOC113689175 [Coffea arabica]
MTEQRRIRRFVQGLNVEIQKDLAVAQINAFSDAEEKEQRVENARLQEEGCWECHEGARHEVAKLGEAKEKVSEKARLLHLADPADIAGSQTTRRTIAGKRRENVCTAEVQTTSSPLVQFYHEMEGGANNQRGPIPNRLRWKGPNLSYHSSIQMVPYKALYERKCRSPIYWDEVGERKVLDPTTIPWMEEAREKIKLIRQRLQTTQSRQKSYADNRRKDLDFKIGDRVFLKITLLRSVTAGRGKKLQPKFVGPFKILQRIGKVAYQLELPSSLSRIHDVFYVSMLKKYYPNPSHILQQEEIEIDESLTYEKKPVQLLDQKVKELRNKQIRLVKILWKNHGIEEAT